MYVFCFFLEALLFRFIEWHIGRAQLPRCRLNLSVSKVVHRDWVFRGAFLLHPFMGLRKGVWHVSVPLRSAW